MVRIVALFVVVAGLALPSAWSQESTPDAKSVKAPGKYFVYTWRCSRSLKLAANTDSLFEVADVVAKGQKDGQKVQVVMGPHNAFDVIGTKAASYTVFQRACRTGYRPAFTNIDAGKVKEYVEKQDVINPTIVVASYAGTP